MRSSSGEPPARAEWRPHQFYTFLYFHDEAVSFAAGHRPCAECRRESYDSYRAAWAEGLGVALPSAKLVNRQLHGERIVRGSHRRRIHRLRLAPEASRRHVPFSSTTRRPSSSATSSGSGPVRGTRAGGRDRPAEPPTSSHLPRPSPSYVPATRSRSTTAPANEPPFEQANEAPLRSTDEDIGTQNDAIGT